MNPAKVLLISFKSIEIFKLIYKTSLSSIYN